MNAEVGLCEEISNEVLETLEEKFSVLERGDDLLRLRRRHLESSVPT